MSDSAVVARLGALGLFVLLAYPLACDRTAGQNDGGGSAGTGASSEDQGRCKDACNQLKFWECNDAADHARCFEACERVSSSVIEVFVACVESDICDPECAGDLEDHVDPTGGEGGSEAGEEGGGGSTCIEACSEFIAAGCVAPVDCAGLCASLSELEQTFVGYCVDRRTGCTLPEECADALPGEGDGGASGPGESAGGDTGGIDPVDTCQGACDDMNFFGCIDPTQHASCRELCTTASTESMDTFVACAITCVDDACYQVFAGQ